MPLRSFREMTLTIGLLALFVATIPRSVLAIGQERYVQDAAGEGAIPLVQNRAIAGIHVDANDFAGVVRAANDLRSDFERVTGIAPTINNNASALSGGMIIVGTIGKSPLIDQLIRDGRIDVKDIRGKWESFLIQAVTAPLPNVPSALVIAGSDKRGTIYGIYDLSEQIGVSPWYWWADVPAKHRDAIYIRPGRFVQGEPSVKYRGIFFNDEAPSLTNFVRAKYGQAPGWPQTANYGHEFYSHVFELILRCKGNYMWPAMWNNAFNEDDAENPGMADMYGIVMGTSHQEAMLRAQKEWDRLPRDVTGGSWNYATHPDVLEKFWRDGLTRNRNYESIITMGLRGENDTAMVLGTREAIDLLNKIIPAQRKIIAETMNPDVTKVPQMWCLYKEVQGYYETGGLNTPPEDITLLWAEDNNGNLRRVPTAEERKRSGGAGIYFHFDYHGGPTDYRWVNTSPLPRIWDQMSLAKQYGADRIWIVNVGKFKNLEFAIDYWFNFAWNTNRWTNDTMREYTRLWATREFGPQHADEIAEIMAMYTKYNGRRKPERLQSTTYSAVNYREAETIAEDYNTLAAKAEALSKLLPADQRDAFYELVLFPVKACANLNEMYVAGAKNALYAQQGRLGANDYAAMARRDYDNDAALMKHFNTEFAGGKWNHFQDDVHIGYTTWSEPNAPSMRQIPLSEVSPAATPTLGVAIEDSASAWPGGEGEPVLPKFNSIAQQKRFIDVFNRGAGAVEYTATASDPWIQISSAKGSVANEQRLWVSIDWTKAPGGAASGSVKIAQRETSVSVKVNAISAADVTRNGLSGFVEDDGFVSIEPEHYTAKTDQGDLKWIRVEDFGRTLSAMRAQGPVDFPSVDPRPGTPCLEYKSYFFSSGTGKVWTVLAPTLAFIPGRDLKYAVSIDDQPPVMVNAIPKDSSSSSRDWDANVRNEAKWVSSDVSIPAPGYHTLKVWLVDPGITMQKIIIDLGGAKASYLGPPESYRQ